MQKLEEIVTYFKENPPPATPLKTKYTTISDVSKFVNSHIEYCQYNKDRKFIKPYYERLYAMYRYLKTQNEQVQNKSNDNA